MPEHTFPPGQSELDALFGPHLEQVCERTARALEASGYSALLVHSGSLLEVFADDRTYPFEAHAPFKVWVPFADVDDCYLHFVPGRRPSLLFHRPEDFWYKPSPLPTAGWTRHFEIRPVADRNAARRALPDDLGRTAYIGAAHPDLEAWGCAAVNPPALMRRLDYPRAVKSPYELACLRAANRLGALGHVAARRAFESGCSEFEIEIEFLRACGQREQELPYNPIIALNEGGAVLHYQLLERQRPARADSMLIDAGVEFAGYASDITRTYSREAEFAALIRAMDSMQRELCAGIRAGVDWRDVHLRAHHLTSVLLRDAGIIDCGADEAVETHVSSVFLPHGIGHLLGLEVHDVGGFMSSPEGPDIPRPEGHPYLRLTRVLEPGFVVTMEPGIYFIEPLLAAARADSRSSRINWRRVEDLKRFGGIRVEDDLAVTTDGCENLTRDAFRSIAAVPAAA